MFPLVLRTLQVTAVLQIHLLNRQKEPLLHQKQLQCRLTLFRLQPVLFLFLFLQVHLYSLQQSNPLFRLLLHRLPPVLQRLLPFRHKLPHNRLLSSDEEAFLLTPVQLHMDYRVSGFLSRISLRLLSPLLFHFPAEGKVSLHPLPVPSSRL